MKLKLIASSILLAYSVCSHAAPMIEGNTLIANDIIDRQIGYAKPGSAEEAARVVVGLYEQYGYLGVKANVEGNTIRIIEPNAEISGDYDQAWLPSNNGVVIIGDIQNSMAMADVKNRFQTMDVIVGDLKGDGKVDMSINRGKATKPYEASVSYSSRGQDATARDLVTIMGAAHVGGGVRVDASVTHGLSDLRSESKGGRMDAGRLSARKATQVGEFSIAGDISGTDIGGKEATQSEYELAGKTRRITLGHRYAFPSVGTVTNNLTWIRRDLSFGLFDVNEKQDYKTWNTSYYGQFGAHQLNASVTKGLTGERSYNKVPIMGTFNPNFYSAQLGYGFQGLAFEKELGYGLSASYFTGSKDMPSAERLSIGGSGRGSSHQNGVVSGYKGYFGEARLYAMKAPYLSDLGIKPYVSINGAATTDAIGDEHQIVATEFGLLGKWRDFSGSVSYANSIKEKNVDHDSRLNMDVSYSF
ncbi:hemolysin activation/secretion-like protein [Pseudomonas putida]|uniref:Hemolysin activation/secretion-like protein n=1 Tax=Pseudomonas putida TaxID=303 RepID=A0A8I1EBV5_PSEPU|nr:hemolysin activation/secretion-like protein [Pseudomonas putida]MBI6882497.1 hemolysin activation/secretion-like protein [Pseudomonas putida]